MQGPAAPKDPEKQRDSFYIIRDKAVFGTKMYDGRGIQYLYQDCERLVNSAQITGGITDEHQLALLRSVDGFRKLVHSIGVSVETKNPKETVSFTFQMYGKQDIYGGGTRLEADFRGDGAEHRINLSQVTWTEDDHIPGQIFVILETPEQEALLNVRLYLNDGYHAPETQAEEEIAFDSAEYQRMIADSCVSCGNVSRLKRVMARAAAGEDITIAYIGGSITQGAGAVPVHTECYAYRSFCQFQERYGKGQNVHVHFIKAGVGGTPSELGVIRFERDVLRDGCVKPDLLIIEFAVNDEGDETKGDCYESLIRKALNLPDKPAVMLLFSVFANDENLQERMIPVGRHYNLPMVSIKNAVTPQFYKKRGAGRVISKNQFFYDIYHPSNSGHRIMADCLAYLWKQAELLEGEAEQIPETPLTGNTFEHVRLLDKKDGYDKAQIRPGGFTATDHVLQCVEMDAVLEPVPEFPFNWHYDGINCAQPYFEMIIPCRALVLIFKDSGETDAARADVYVDGKYVRTADPFVNGWLHCNPAIIINEPESSSHLVRIELQEADRNKKFTILGFGYCE